MNEPLKVTIVTPSYNQGQFIERTILSVLNQSYQHIEYILVDGGSTDETAEIVERYRDRIDVLIWEKDKGQSDAINKGFKAATGRLVGWLNSDDVLYPDAVEQIVELYHRHPGGSIYYPSKLDFIDADDRIFRTITLRIPNRNHLLNVCPDIIQQGSFYDREMLRAVDYVDEAIYYCMDLDLWIRLLERGPIYSYDERPLAGFRFWGETKTSQGGTAFLDCIRETLRKYGAKRYSRATLRMDFLRFRIWGGKLKRSVFRR